eukprot:GHVQ01018010.1.p1 GENE.GHVQ01018010.1~~GHVQ01018010.1.p1  ORF type:complete len:111 (-),score=6.54 GHVQ01018010.1:169-501(-)
MKYSSMTALGLSVGCLMTCISPASAGIESMGTLVDDGGQIRPPSLSENLRLWQEHRKHLYLGPPAQGCEIDQGTSLLGNRTHSNEPVCDNIVGCAIGQRTSLLGKRKRSN